MPSREQPSMPPVHLRSHLINRPRLDTVSFAGVGGSIDVSHTEPALTPGAPGSHVLLCLRLHEGAVVTLPFDPSHETLSVLLAQVHYHAGEARRLNAAPTRGAVPAPPVVSGADESA